MTTPEDDRRPAADPRSPYRPPKRRIGRRITAYWPLAIAEVAVAIVVALTLPDLEAHYHWRDGLDYDASTAQATLAAIAGGMITLTGFVLTTVTLMVQTVQGQSSRLLQALNRTDKSPLLFGTFTATFTFSLLVLSVVHDNDVPTVSITVALALVLVCAGLFLRLLVTFRTTLTVGGLTSTIGAQMRGLIDALYPAPFGSAECDVAPQPATPAEDQPTWVLRHGGQPGVFQAFNETAVVRLAAAAGSQIRFVPAIGDFVVTGSALATGAGPAPDLAALHKLVRVGASRTLEQDPAFGIRMLADIAIRALSSAVNDPTSAVQALDQIDDILHRLACRSLGDGLLHDPAGRVVVRYRAPTWDTFLSLAIDEILHYGAGSMQVTRRIRALLEDLLTSTPQARWPAVTGKLEALRRATRRSFPDPAEEAEAAAPDRQGIGSPH